MEQLQTDNGLYIGDWANESWRKTIGFAAMAQDYELTPDEILDLAKCEILIAYYAIDGYDGESFVLFRKDGKLYEVNASHCSCYGLEGQWEPEETTVGALSLRLENSRLGTDYDGDNKFKAELQATLARARGTTT